jgi:hypothetical protein
VIMTETEFINHEVDTWGWDYIENLLSGGYSPVLTDKGWYWLLTPRELSATLGSGRSLPVSSGSGG